MSKAQCAKSRCGLSRSNIRGCINPPTPTNGSPGMQLTAKPQHPSAAGRTLASDTSYGVNSSAQCLLPLLNTVMFQTAARRGPSGIHPAGTSDLSCRAERGEVVRPDFAPLLACLLFSTMPALHSMSTRRVSAPRFARTESRTVQYHTAAPIS